jgi:hypothetical protein
MSSDSFPRSDLGLLRKVFSIRCGGGGGVVMEALLVKLNQCNFGNLGFYHRFFKDQSD